MGEDMSRADLTHSKTGACSASTSLRPKACFFICPASEITYRRRFNSFNGQPRNLPISDKSLMATYSQSLC